MDAFFKSAPPTDTKSEIFRQIYDHYTGKLPIDDMNVLNKGFRDRLGDGSNYKANAKKTRLAVQFRYNTNQYQAPDEYLVNGVLQHISNQTPDAVSLEHAFHTIITATPKDNKLALLYDVYLHSLYFGLPRPSNTSEKPANSPTLKSYYDFLDQQNELRSDMSTLILHFGRQSTTRVGGYEVTPLQRITLPTLRAGAKKPAFPDIKDRQTAWSAWGNSVKDVTDASSFSLDSMVVLQGTDHFVTYVKCDESDEWIYDNGISEGELGSKEGSVHFTSFDDMMAKHGNAISQNIILMIYSK